MLLNISQCTAQPPQHRINGPDVRGAAVEKAWLEGQRGVGRGHVGQNVVCTERRGPCRGLSIAP